MPLLPLFTRFSSNLSTRHLLAAFFLLISTLSCQRQVFEAGRDYQNPLAAYQFSCRPLDSLTVRDALPALEAEYGAYLDCPEPYRDKFLAALSFYPDLKGVPIRLIQKTLKTSMAARPAGFAVARNGRSYKIYADDITDKVTDFRRYPYAAQIGCFIHELGHVAFYEHRSNVRLLYDGARYVTSQNYRSKYERHADHNALERGGGYYGYLFRHYTLNHAGISEEYRQFKRENYYTGRKLLELHREAAKDNGRPAGDCLEPAY